MMRSFSIFITLCLLIVCSSMAQEKKAAENEKSSAGAKKGPQSFEQFFKEGMKRVDAIFPVYELDDKYFMEIPDRYLGRDVFISGQMLKGIGVRGVGQASAGVVYFKKGPKDKLYMYSEYNGMIASEKQPGLQRIFE